MLSPANGRSRHDLLARPARGVGPVQDLDDDSLTPAQLPDYSDASDADLVTHVHDHNALAFVELYRRTLPAAHGVSRRLLSDTGDIEGVLRRVYTALWHAPAALSTPVVQHVRVSCFALAEAHLRSRAAPPAEPSVATVVAGLPPAGVRRLTAIERVLDTMPERTRRAVLMAHDAGVASSDQDDPEAGDLLETGLLALADPGEAPATSAPSNLAGMSDWILGLLPADHAADVAAAVRGDRRLVDLEKSLRRARRRLEGLPATPNMAQRVLAEVLSAPIPKTAAPAHGPARHSGVALIAASIVLVLVAGVVSFSSWLSEPALRNVAQASTPRAVAAPVAPPAPPRAPSAAPTRDRTRQRPTGPRIVPPVRNAAQQTQPAATPLRVIIPKMQVRHRLVGLSVLDDGTLASPDDYDAPGWYREGVKPGDTGPAVIVGHVDSTEGPAVFFQLDQLKRGDKAHVERADGTTVTFVVDRVERYAKDNFPSEQVYGPTPGAELRLITCGGAFDNTTRSYEDNVVAYAHIQQPKALASAKARAKAKARQRGNQEQGNDRRSEARADASGTYDHLGRLRTPETKDRQRRSGRRQTTEPTGGT